MNNYEDLIKSNKLIVKKQTIKRNSTIIETDSGKFVIKKKFKDNHALFAYLKSRGFYCFPNIIAETDNYEMYNFLENVPTPKEQKAEDAVYLMSILHNKTTFYKEKDLNKIKIFYEDTQTNINYLLSYYQDLQIIIEKNIYMAPSEYLLIRNISFLYQMLSLSKSMLEEWYKIMSNAGKRRYAMVHHNLLLDHFIKDQQSYFISWDQAELDVPIYDFYYFYLKNSLDLDYETLLNIYKAKYPLLKEEELELYILLTLPNKLVLKDNEQQAVKEIYLELERLKKALQIISKSNQKYSQEEKKEFNN